MLRRIFLMVALAAILAGSGLAVAMLRRDPPATPVAQPALPVLIANYRQADRIELVQDSNILWLERRGQVWGLAQAGGYPVRPEAAASLIDGLLALRLDHPVSAPDAGGTLVRVLAISGEVLGAIIIGPDDGILRRPGSPAAWQGQPTLHVSVNPADWLDAHLPVPDLAQVRVVGGDEAANAGLRGQLRALPVTTVRAAPQIHPTPIRSITLALPDGTASLDLGRLGGQDWLHVSGSSAWARSLGAYAFAIPPGSLDP